jgi:uncharacterized protein
MQSCFRNCNVREKMLIGEMSSILAQFLSLTAQSVQGGAAIMMDDVAVNAKMLSGLKKGHKGHTIAKVIGGSLLNKVVLLPVALALSAIASGTILPLLALGGLNLAHEGIEKLRGHDHELVANTTDPEALEKKKIKEALKVDFILSAEVTLLTLSMVMAAPFLMQLGVLAAAGVGVTLGLYGLIGGIIKLDDIGRWLSQRSGNNLLSQAARKIGPNIEKSVPLIMKGISVVGTVALFMIGGELIMHAIPGAETLVSSVFGGLSVVAEIGVGLAAGLASVPVVAALSKVKSHVKKPDFLPAVHLPQVKANWSKMSLKSILNKVAHRPEKPALEVEKKPDAPKPL